MVLIRLYALEPEGLRSLQVPDGKNDLHELLDDQPLGIYEGWRTFQGDRFLHLERHVDRADRSLALAGIERRVDRPLLARGLREAAEAWSPGDARIRFDELSEPATALGTSCCTLLALAPLQEFPAGTFDHGVHVGRAPDLQRGQPLAKDAHWVLERRPKTPAETKPFERILVDADGSILEGTSSNFFFVRDGVLQTAASGMLEGVTRGITLELAARANIPVREEAVRLADLQHCEEAILTSASRGLVPVRTIEDTAFSERDPGPVWKALHESYLAACQGEVQTAAEALLVD